MPSCALIPCGRQPALSFCVRSFLTNAVSKFGIMAMVLFLLTASSVYFAETVAKASFARLNTLQDVSLLSLLLVARKDVGALIMEGVERRLCPHRGSRQYFSYSSSFSFWWWTSLATIVTVLSFSLLFLEDYQKRVSAVISIVTSGCSIRSFHSFSHFIIPCVYTCSPCYFSWQLFR